jgi:alkanesulfonate monooxygenase SsuD/methylene tetrahydromethanopterin reductase-like flavin-dependent oxidoreductase (luciferase family)
MHRGFGIAAAVNADWIGALASAAEAAGYATFWVNDVPGANGLEQLSRAQEATERIRLGVGVLAVDRWSSGAIIDEFRRLSLDPARTVIGLGAGQLRKGALDRTSQVAAELMGILPVRVLIGALGPQMCRMAGSAAHGVILNWVTPVAAIDSAELTREGAARVGRTRPEIVAYVRTATSPAAGQRLTREAEAYESYPAYARHFEAMGVRAIETTVNGPASVTGRAFAHFEPIVDEVVARAIAAEDTLEAYREVLIASAPGSFD